MRCLLSQQPFGDDLLILSRGLYKIMKVFAQIIKILLISCDKIIIIIRG